MEKNYSRPEPSCDFIYPAEENEEEPNRLHELLLTLLFSLIEHRNPKVKLCCLCYSSGIDISYILKCKNTISAIAQRMGISKQAFVKELKLVIKEFKFKKQNINGYKRTSDKYALSNFTSNK